MKLSEDLYNLLEKENNPNVSKFKKFIYKDDYNKFEFNEELHEFRRLFYFLENIDEFSSDSKEFNLLESAIKNSTIGRFCTHVLNTKERFRHPDILCDCNTCINRYYNMKNSYNR